MRLRRGVTNRDNTRRGSANLLGIRGSAKPLRSGRDGSMVAERKDGRGIASSYNLPIPPTPADVSGRCASSQVGWSHAVVDRSACRTIVEISSTGLVGESCEV